MRKWKAIVFSAGIILLSFILYLDAHYTVPILMFHSLDEKRVDSYAAVSLPVFSRQMRFIKRNNYRVLPLEEYCQMLAAGSKANRKSVVITFDDGDKSILPAIEVLKEFGYPATIFLPADRVGQENYLTEDDIRWILSQTRIRLGSHTLTHPYLPRLSDAALENEIIFSKQRLQDLFSTRVETFSYPGGGFDERSRALVRSAGYQCACATNRGFSRRLDPWALRRIKVTNRDSDLKLLFKLSGFYNFFRKVKKPY